MPEAPSTETIYVRVPESTKEATRSYAATRGVTLTAAISDLLGRGLEALENDESVVRLQQQVQEKTQEVKDLEARVQGLAALSTTSLGTCPTCNAVVTALDVVGRRACANGHPLQPDNTATQAAPGLDERQAMVLFGAVALLLGALALSSK